MSKSQNPLTGHMSGSMANFATYTRYGKNIIRSKAFQPKNANSVSQIAQRASFKLIVNAYESFGGIMDIAFPKRAENQSPYNAFMAANLPEAIDKTGATPVIDYSKLTASKGILPKVPVTSAIASTVGITLNYKTDILNPKVSSTDEVIAFALLKNGELILGKKVRGSDSDNSIILSYQDVKAADVECCYLFALNTDGSNASDSTFVQVA